MALEGVLYAVVLVLSSFITIIICLSTCCCCCKEEESANDETRKKICNQKLLFIPYRLIFNFTLTKIYEATGGEYLFGGYKQQSNKKKRHCLHAYYLSMLLVVFNWFIIVVMDQAFYRKVFTCNDPNSKDSNFLCFSLKEGYGSGPIDCSIEENINVPVICYVKSLNIVTALSIAFSFARFILLLIQGSFMFTLWCVKKGNSGCVSIILVHIFVTALYFIGFIACLILSTTRDKYDVENPLYGDRVLRYFMAVWGFFTIFLITILSPYCWLVKKNTQEYLPVYKTIEAGQPLLQET